MQSTWEEAVLRDPKVDGLSISNEDAGAGGTDTGTDGTGAGVEGTGAAEDGVERAREATNLHSD